MGSSGALRIIQWTPRVRLGSNQPIDLEDIAETACLWIFFGRYLALGLGQSDGRRKLLLFHLSETVDRPLAASIQLPYATAPAETPIPLATSSPRRSWKSASDAVTEPTGPIRLA